MKMALSSVPRLATANASGHWKPSGTVGLKMPELRTGTTEERPESAKMHSGVWWLTSFAISSPDWQR